MSYFFTHIENCGMVPLGLSGAGFRKPCKGGSPPACNDR